MTISIGYSVIYTFHKFSKLIFQTPNSSSKNKLVNFSRAKSL